MTGAMMQTVTGVDTPGTAPRTASRLKGSARSGGPLDLYEAEYQGAADVFTAGGSMFAITSAYNPVDLTFTGTDAVFDLTVYDGEGSGKKLRYGPATGTFMLSQGGSGAPVVKLGWQGPAAHIRRRRRRRQRLGQRRRRRRRCHAGRHARGVRQRSRRSRPPSGASSRSSRASRSPRRAPG